MTKRLTLLVLLCLFSLDCFGQSLADVARKERERQKQTQPQKKAVIVESGVPTTTTAGTSSTSETALLPVLTPGGLKDNNGHDEKYWRDRFQQARNDAKRAEARVQLLDNKLKELNTQYLNRTDIYNRENVVGKEIGDAQKQLDDAHKEADQANQKITSLEDELHRAGGPPWLGAVMRYLGIDGGGSKTAFLLVDEYYNEICHLHSGPSNHLSVGNEAARESIAGGISQLTERPDIICAGFAGAGRPDSVGFYKEVLHSLVPEAQVIIESDAFISSIGAIGIDPGILLIAGTGSIVIGRDKERAMFRVGGWGPYFGDEGSGFWIGREAIRAALRSIDRQSSTEFAQRIAATFSMKSVTEVVGAWATGKIGVPDVAGLFPEVVAVYPDEPAKQILTEAAAHLRQLVEIAEKRVGVDDCRKSLSGSVAGHRIMRELIGIQFEEPRHSAEWGAVIWARQHSNG